MKILDKPISFGKLKRMARDRFGDMVKVVVDIEKGVMAIDAELHADEEAFLLDGGSLQENLWGINLYPEIEGEDWIEFDSMINVRPSRGNKSRGIEDPKIRGKIITMVNRFIKK